jgi:hypothetical protein
MEAKVIFQLVPDFATNKIFFATLIHYGSNSGLSFLRGTPSTSHSKLVLDSDLFT